VLAISLAVAACLAQPAVASAGSHHGSGLSPLGRLVQAATATVHAAATPPAASSGSGSSANTLVGGLTQGVAATVAAATDTDATAAVGTVTAVTGGALQGTVDQLTTDVVPSVTSLARVTLDVPVLAVGALLRPPSGQDVGDGYTEPTTAPAPSTAKQHAPEQAERAGILAATPAPEASDAVMPAAPAAAPTPSAPPTPQHVPKPRSPVRVTEPAASAPRTHHPRRRPPLGATLAKSGGSLVTSLFPAGTRDSGSRPAHHEHLSGRGRWNGDVGAGGGTDASLPRPQPIPVTGSVPFAFPVPLLDRRVQTPLGEPAAEPAPRIPTPPG
jgi:hypothetical protein